MGVYGGRQPLKDLTLFLFGVFGLATGFGLFALKKWAWHTGIIALGLVVVSGLVRLLLKFEIFSVVSLTLEVFLLAALFGERNAFFITLKRD